MASINEWELKLLDISKKNRLISFKERKEGLVELVLPEYNKIFNYISNEESMYLNYPVGKDEGKPNSEDLIKRCSKNLKDNDILIYSNGDNPVSLVKKMNKEAKEFYDEKGVNILFITFGILNYKDAKDDTNLRAPLLLLPIKLGFDSKTNRYYCYAIDNLVSNVTLERKLSDDYKLKMPSLSEKVNLEKYFKEVSKILKNYEFTLEEKCYIAPFSYYKINMYEDLVKNEKKVIANANVKLILNEPNDGKDKDKKVKEIDNLDISNLKNVVAADSSQKKAVALSKTGESFVLQGPPGTGKSQTITNIIAENLYLGKKVLFVSEKAAALKVVEDNLIKAKLGDAVLNMHSSAKKDKTTILTDIYETLQKPKVEVLDTVEGIKEEYKNTIDYLEKYRTEIYKSTKPLDISLFDVINLSSKYINYPSIQYNIDNVEEKDGKYLNKIKDLLDSYYGISKLIGRDYHQNPFYGFNKRRFEYGEDEKFVELLKELLDQVNHLYLICFNAEDETGVEVLTFNEAVKFNSFIKDLQNLDEYFDALFDIKSAEETKKLICEVKELIKSKSEQFKKINKYFDNEILNIDEKVLEDLINAKGLFVSLKKDYKASLKVLYNYQKERKHFSVSKAKKYSINIKEYIKIYSDLNDNLQSLKELINNHYKGEETDFDALLEVLDSFINNYLDGRDYSKFKSVNAEEFKEVLKKLNKDFKEYIGKTKKCIEQVKPYFDEKLFDYYNSSNKVVKNKVTDMINTFDNIKDYLTFLSIYDKFEAEGVSEFLDKVLDNKSIELDKAFNTYMKHYTSELAFYLYNKNEELSKYNKTELNKNLMKYQDLLDKMHDVSKAEICQYLSSHRPSTEIIAQGSPLYLLKREAEKKKMQMPIRVIMEKIPELIQQIKPCILMSPLSVSTYFINASAINFDLVIFDEASQIFPEDAIGSIYRGKQLIVVGDSKQMPPSNFFTTLQGNNAEINELNEEEDNIMSYESILDLATTRLYNSRLNWHYRSRFEDLIAFSNEYIYSTQVSRLKTFPSSQGKEDFLGIDFYKVDGHFDSQTRSNEIEAQEVVKRVLINIEKYPNRSLGIIAFGIGQQREIEKYINKEAANNKALKDFINKECDEPFFIKNLENVQGNERDTIIFSVGYSKDTNGVLKFNFGPIIREGGERRLNVAFTRAKYNVQLVSSISYKDFSINGTLSKGAEFLKYYLEFAETLKLKRNEDVDNSTNEFDFIDNNNYIATEVKDYLEENGYTTVCKLGNSDYPVDIAVKHPIDNRYIMAIEIDSIENKNLVCIGDQETRRSVLNGLGWNYYKLYSFEWMMNKNSVKKDIISKLEKYLDGAIVDNGGEENYNDFCKTLEEKSFEVYKEVDYELFIKIYNKNKNFPNLINSILAEAAPINKAVLLKNLLPIFNTDKVYQKVKDQFDVKLDLIKGIYQKNDFLYISKPRQVYQLRVPEEGNSRDVAAICIEEIAGGILKVISLNTKVNEEGIIEAIVDLLNISRKTENVVGRIQAAIKHLRKLGYISEKDGTYTLKKDLSQLENND